MPDTSVMASASFDAPAPRPMTDPAIDRATNPPQDRAVNAVFDPIDESAEPIDAFAPPFAPTLAPTFDPNFDSTFGPSSGAPVSAVWTPTPNTQEAAPLAWSSDSADANFASAPTDASFTGEATDSPMTDPAFANPAFANPAFADATMTSATFTDAPINDRPAFGAQQMAAPIAPLTLPDRDVAAVPHMEPRLAPQPMQEVAPIVWVARADLDEPLPTPKTGNGSSNGSSNGFVRAGSNWRIGGIFPATAAADDGTLALRRADARWALADVQAPGDFIVEAVVDFTAGVGFGVLFRATADDTDRISGYSFDIDPIAGGGGYLLRQWEDNKQHWRPMAQASVTDPGRLFGRHLVAVTLRADQLTVTVDGDAALSLPSLTRSSIELGQAPCRGSGVGVQAWATTEVTVESSRVARS